MRSRGPGAFSGGIKRACFGTNWVAHQRRYQPRLNKARCQIRRAKTTCFTEKCGEPDGRRRPGRSWGPSSCVWLGRDLDSSHARPCSASARRFSIFINCALTLNFRRNKDNFRSIEYSPSGSLSAAHLTFFVCYTCVTAEFVMMREEEKVMYNRFVWGNVIYQSSWHQITRTYRITNKRFCTFLHVCVYGGFSFISLFYVFTVITFLYVNQIVNKGKFKRL